MLLNPLILYLVLSGFLYFTYDEARASTLKSSVSFTLLNLNPTQKIELAKRMKCDYFASNKQIKGILKLDIAIVEELFGH